MLTIYNDDHMATVKAFATSVGALDALQEKLDYLATYGGGHNTCHLFPDFAPYSFAFRMADATGATWFNGGLIYHGPGQPGDGSAPAFSVDLSNDPAVHRWSVHT